MVFYLLQILKQNELFNSIIEKKDEFFVTLPTDVADRLVVRPEDNLPQVTDSIKTFKDALLHVLEVIFNIVIS